MCFVFDETFSGKHSAPALQHSGARALWCPVTRAPHYPATPALHYPGTQPSRHPVAPAPHHNGTPPPLHPGAPLHRHPTDETPSRCGPPPLRHSGAPQLCHPTAPTFRHSAAPGRSTPTPQHSRRPRCRTIPASCCPGALLLRGRPSMPPASDKMQGPRHAPRVQSNGSGQPTTEVQPATAGRCHPPSPAEATHGQ
jgi:hypothetical protein